MGNIMCKKIILFVVLGLTAALVYAQAPGAAKASVNARKAHADRNKDGQVDRVEIKSEKNWEHRQKAKVNTKWEAKTDADKDGVVEPAEIAARRQYIREKSVVDRPWENAADANNDGKVDLKEVRVYHVTQMDTDHDGSITVTERSAYWTKTKAVVNTELEKKYDADNDGYLSWVEGKELLKDKLVVVNTKGKAIVNTDLEAEFDANGDGVIDRVEAPAVQSALKE